MQMVTADIPSFQRRAASVNLASPNMNIEVVHSVAHSLYEIWEKILVNQRSGEWWKGIPSTPPSLVCKSLLQRVLATAFKAT